MKKSWWSCEFECTDAFESAFELHECGAAGTEILADNKVRASIEAGDQEIAAFVAAAASRGFSLSSQSPIPDHNWCQDVAALMEPIAIAGLRIVPITEAAACPEIKEDSVREIFLVVGMGFGTGHHETTRTVLSFLQAEPFTTTPPKKILDVGTGSGVLAIAASILFHAPVKATDNDPAALDNARENIAINQCAKQIHTSLEPLNAFHDPFDLIVANIYAEVLCGMARDFERLLAPRGSLLLSGIAADRWEEVLAVMSAALPSAALSRKEQLGNWVTALFLNNEQ